MWLNITIRQSLLGRETMPLETILGETLRFGRLAGKRVIPGLISEDGFVIYDPERLGRGAFVTWRQEEHRRLELRLPLPSTAQELTSVFGAVMRMAAHWNAKVDVNGKEVWPGDLNAMLAFLINVNKGLVERMAREVAEGVSESITLSTVMRPLVMGKAEASAFLKNPNAFAAWLHEMQKAEPAN